MKAAFIAATIGVVAAGNVLDREVYERAFFDHVTKYDLKFKSGAEFVERLQVFSNNYDLIQAHNAYNTPTLPLGLTLFSHLFLAAVLEAVLGGSLLDPNSRRAAARVHTAPADMSTVPTEIDHVAKGAVTDVKNQGSCGSCWAFSAVGALESAHFYKHNVLNTFAEQEVVSCDNVDGGCNGGWMDDAFSFVQRNGGLTDPTSYPYTSGTTGQTGTCKTTGYVDDANVAPTGFVDVQTGSVDALMSAVAQQPVSIAIQANQMAFQSYKDGVITGNCGQRLDHGVLAVGYGTWTDGTPYWKVKNSWGTSWGMDGYVLIERSAADKCGVLDAASYPTL
jgi:hypothetical protein